MTLRVQLVIASPMSRSIIGSALADNNDIELIETPPLGTAPAPHLSLVQPDAAPPHIDAHIDVVVVDGAELDRRENLFAQISRFAPVGIVSVDGSGTVDRLYRLDRQDWRGRGAGRMGLAEAIREAAR